MGSKSGNRNIISSKKTGFTVDLSKAKFLDIAYASHSAYLEFGDKRYFAKITGHAKDGTVGEKIWTDIAKILGITAPEIEISYTSLAAMPDEIAKNISRSGEGNFKAGDSDFTYTQKNIDERGIILSRDWKETAEKHGWKIISESGYNNDVKNYDVFPNEHIDIIMLDYLLDNTDRHLNNFMYATWGHGNSKHAHPLPFDAAYCFDSRETDRWFHIKKGKEGLDEYEQVKDFNAFKLHPARALPFPEWYRKHAQGSEDIVKETVKMYRGKGGRRAMIKDIKDFQKRLSENKDSIIKQTESTAKQYVRKETWGDIPLKESMKLNVESMVKTVENKLEYLLNTSADDLADQLAMVE